MYRLPVFQLIHMPLLRIKRNSLRKKWGPLSSSLLKHSCRHNPEGDTCTRREMCHGAPLLCGQGDLRAFSCDSVKLRVVPQPQIYRGLHASLLVWPCYVPLISEVPRMSGWGGRSHSMRVRSTTREAVATLIYRI